MTLSNQDAQQWTVREGDELYGADGDKVGKIIEANPDYVVVEKGWFFPTDYYVPVSAIASYNDGKAYLNLTKDQALNQGWDVAPGERVREDYGTGDPYGDTTGPLTTDENVGYAPGVDSARVNAADQTVQTDMRQRAPADQTPPVNQTQVDQTNVPVNQTNATSVNAGETTSLDAGETLRVPVSEEELTATTHPVERGRVVVSKDVVTEERHIDVPVREERVRVEHRAPREGDVPEGDAFQEGTVEVPIMGEDVDVQKRTRQTGEVDVTKTAEQQQRQVQGRVRREQVHVDKSGNLEEENATTQTAPDDLTANPPVTDKSAEQH